MTICFMRILLINIRYGYVGGPERYLFNLKKLLESNNHQVIPFSIKYALNEPTEYEDYFATPLSDNESIYFKDQKWNFRGFFKTLERNFYSNEVERKLSALIKDTKPDFALVLLYLRKLSPAVLFALHKEKIPFAVRLSDYAMICPNLTLFRDRAICELCVNGDIVNSVRYKCVHNSYSASLVNYFATKYHHSKGYFDLIKYFISPSRFLIKKMVEGGYNQEKFFHIPTFAFISGKEHTGIFTNQVVYAGRIEYVKGVHLLLDAVSIISNTYNMKLKVKIAGNGNEEYIRFLKNRCLENKINGVEFKGNLKSNELLSLLQESACSVIPSLWYDNLPNSALESLSCGTPVIAPAHGCFPEFIKESETGMLFNPGDANDLSEKIRLLMGNPDLCKTMRRKSIDYIKEYHSPQKHYNTLMSVIKRTMGKDFFVL